MSEQNTKKVFVVGLALFSMFFGSGNLIFPMLLGAKYQSLFLVCTLGFVITAAILPTLGIMAMIPAHGIYDRLLDGLVSKRVARYFFLVVLTFFIPLGSGPRCVVLAHASIVGYLPFHLPLWLFSFLFLALCYFCLSNKSNVIDILGKWLTPALLLSLSVIVISCFLTGHMEKANFALQEVFLDSLVKGYYTQDLIAAIFFSSSVLALVKRDLHHEHLALKIALKAGLMAVLLLSIVYALLIYASASHGSELVNVSGEKIVSALSDLALGKNFGFVSSIAVSLACLTTEIALILVFADFLSHNIFHESSNKKALFITLFLVWALSLIEFKGIMALISPAMQIIYPILSLLVIRFLVIRLSQGKWLK